MGLISYVRLMDISINLIFCLAKSLVAFGIVKIAWSAYILSVREITLERFMPMRKFFSAISLIICLFCLTGASKSYNEAKSVELYTSADITIYSNGGAVNLFDSKGNPANPISYDGEIYLPIISMSQIVGKRIYYDDSTKQIIASNDNYSKSVPLLHYIYQEGESPDRLYEGRNKNILKKGVPYNKTGLQTAKGVSTIPTLYIEEEWYAPIKYLEHIYGLTVQWNETLCGVDVFTPTFAETVRQVVANESDRIPLYDSAYNIRSWAMQNIFQDSAKAFQFRVSKVSGQDYLVWDRTQVADLLTQEDRNKQEVAKRVSLLKLGRKSPKEKADAIAKYILEENEYCEGIIDDPSSSSLPRTMEDILNSRRQICEGYSRLFQAMCREAGLNCQYILGYVKCKDSKTVESHAWNRVFINGEWLYYDLTFADTSKKSNEWLGKRESDFKNVRYEYGVRISY